MAKTKRGLGYRIETHVCPYCGKELRVVVGMFGVLEGVFRSDQTIESQEAEKELRLKEFDKAVEKEEKRTSGE
jgi:hypothetical protein